MHEIDRIAEPRFSCSGPIAPLDGNGSAGWSLPQVEDRYVRAAMHAVINGTSYKIVVGECAGWDTDSRISPPPDYAAPTPAPLPSRCGASPNRSTFQPPLIDGMWLFDLDADESESCDLSGECSNGLRQLSLEISPRLTPTTVAAISGGAGAASGDARAAAQVPRVGGARALPAGEPEAGPVSLRPAA